MTEAMMPGRPYGKTAVRMTSHLVAPSAYAASSLAWGVCRKISRVSAVTIGADRTVANAIAATPKCGGVSAANHLVSVRKLLLSALRAGIALAMRKTAIATMMTRTTDPAVVVVARKTVSAPKRRLRGSA